MTTTTVEFGGLSFANGPLADADGVRWVLTGLDGWGDGAEVDATRNRRPGAHGEFAERAWRGAGVVIVDVDVLAPTRAAAAVVKRRLAATLADGTFSDLTVTDVDEGTLSAQVRLATKPDISWFAPTAIRAQFQLYQADPLRYGHPVVSSTTFPTATGGLRFPLYSNGAGVNVGALDFGTPSTTGRAIITNTGTADTWPQFEVGGQVMPGGFEIATVGTGRRLVYTGEIPAGSRLVLDAATGAVLLDGEADRANLLTFRDWWPVPAGGSVEFAFIPLGSTSAASLSVTARPAFW